MVWMSHFVASFVLARSRVGFLSTFLRDVQIHEVNWKCQVALTGVFLLFRRLWLGGMDVYLPGGANSMFFVAAL